MTNIVREPRMVESYRLPAPHSFGALGHPDPSEEPIYTESELQDKVLRASAQAKDETNQAHEASRIKMELGYARALDLVEECAKVFREAQKESNRDVTQRILDLSYRLAEKIVRVEVPRRDETLLSLLDELLADLTDPGKIIVRISSVNSAYLTQCLEAEPHRWPTFDLRPNDRITPGGCVVETESGCWDSKIESQLNEMYAEISKVSLEARSGQIEEVIPDDQEEAA